MNCTYCTWDWIHKITRWSKKRHELYMVADGTSYYVWYWNFSSVPYPICVGGFWKILMKFFALNMTKSSFCTSRQMRVRLSWVLLQRSISTGYTNGGPIKHFFHWGEFFIFFIFANSLLTLRRRKTYSRSWLPISLNIFWQYLQLLHVKPRKLPVVILYGSLSTGLLNSGFFGPLKIYH